MKFFCLKKIVSKVNDFEKENLSKVLVHELNSFCN